MISRGHSLITGVSHTADTQADLYYPKTFALAAYELAPSLCIPPASKVLPSVARSAQQEDRALFPAVRPAFESLNLPHPLLDVFAIAVAVVFGLSGAAALIVGLFMALFVKF